MGYQNLVLMALIVALVIGQYGNCKGTSLHPDDFVQRSGTHFVVNGKPLYFNGFNAYWLMIIASDPSTRSKVTTTFQEASQDGVNVVRTMAFNDGGYKALQISPGSYDENVFKGLDFVISEAGKYGVRLILSLVNNWKALGGKSQYVQWARERGQNVNGDDDFFTHPVVKQYYKNHIMAVLTRNNSITGLAFKDNPTIFAWELMNEPRSNQSIQDWVSEMAHYVKSIDNNHLLEVGLEGFYGESIAGKRQFNPGNQLFGTDFISNNQIPEIDFSTMHVYLEYQWLSGSDEGAQNAFVDKWVQVHIQDSNDILGKPILLTEFGMNSSSSGYTVAKRNSFFEKMYNFIYNSASNRGSCAGGLFWQVLAQGMEGYGDGFEVILEESPSTINLVTQQSKRLSNLG